MCVHAFICMWVDVTATLTLKSRMYIASMRNVESRSDLLECQHEIYFH